MAVTATKNQTSLYALCGNCVLYEWNHMMLNSLINVMWLHCLNLQVHWPMALITVAAWERQWQLRKPNYSLYALCGSCVLYEWNHMMLNSLVNVMWLHCLNLQAYWPMAHGNSLKCIVFVMYQVASFQQMVAQRYLYDHQRKTTFCYLALVLVTCEFPCMHCWSRQEMLQ